MALFELPEFEDLLQQILDRARTDIDKTEGSIFRDAVSPVVVELLVAYLQLQMFENQTFADTATGEYLTRRASEFGVDRKPAVAATRKANFNVDVAVGIRFSIDNLYFKVTQGGTNAEVQCETAGEAGNAPVGEMVAVDFVSDLTTATLGDIVIPGSEEESDDDLRERYYQKVRQPAMAGNRAQYELWAKEVDGVGDVKVFPIWNGRGTVKIVIVDTEYNIASAELVANVQNYIDPNVNGDGGGMAPIGAVVTVVSATPKPINISVTLTLQSGKTVNDVRTILQNKIDEYFKTVAFKDNMVRYSKIANAIIDTDYVIDYSNLTINGGTANISLSDAEIPQRGTVTLNV